MSRSPGRNPDRFWQKVNKDGPRQPHMQTACWLWTGATNQRFGHLRPRSVGIDNWHTPLIYAHHAAWVLTYGQIPKGMHVLHACLTLLCVRPDHLYGGNTQDMAWHTSLHGKRRSYVLSPEQREEIRDGLVRGETRKALAERYNVSLGAIDNLRRARPLQHKKRSRKLKLLALLKANPTYSVRELAGRLFMSEATIRHDLQQLAIPASLRRENLTTFKEALAGIPDTL